MMERLHKILPNSYLLKARADMTDPESAERKLAIKLLQNTTLYGDCLLWKGGVSEASGYGIRRTKGRTELVHRLVLEGFFCIPYAGAIARHDPILCEFRHCCSPRHLKWGTQRENMGDKIIKASLPNSYAIISTASNLPKREIVRKLRAGKSLEVVAEDYSVSVQGLRCCLYYWEVDPATMKTNRKNEGKDLAEAQSYLSTWRPRRR